MIPFQTLSNKLQLDKNSVVFGNIGSLMDRKISGDFLAVDIDLHHINKLDYPRKKISTILDLSINKYKKILLLPNSHDSLDVYYNRLVECKHILKLNGICYLVSRVKEGARRYQVFMEQIFGNVVALTKIKGDWILKSVKTDNTSIEKKYIENTIAITIKSKEFIFCVEKELFSFNEIDKGSRFLSNSINPTGEVCLDFGCGYGFIGIVFSSYFKKMIMVDSNIRAIEIAKKNILLNHVVNAEIYLNDCLKNFQYTGKVQTIISNPPTHIGAQNMLLFFNNAWNVLSENGELYIVINRILNYKKYYEKFKSNEIICQNNKYKIIKLIK